MNMKKLLIVLLASLIMSSLLFPVCCEAANMIDLDNLGSLPDEKLFESYEKLGKEIAVRGSGTKLPDGVYLVGRDIAPGNYNIKYYAYGSDYYSFYIRVYLDNDCKIKYEKEGGNIRDFVAYYYDVNGSGELQFSLEEGQVVDVSSYASNGIRIIEKIQGLFME